MPKHRGSVAPPTHVCRMGWCLALLCMLAFAVGGATPLAAVSWRLGAHASPIQFATHARAMQQGSVYHHDNADELRKTAGATAQTIGIYPHHHLPALESGAGLAKSFTDVWAAALGSTSPERAAGLASSVHTLRVFAQAQDCPQPGKPPPILCSQIGTCWNRHAALAGHKRGVEM